MSSTQVYLVTGGGRGIGASLVKELAKDPNSIVYAGFRTLEGADEVVAKLSEGAAGTIKPIAITSADEPSNKAAAEFITKEHGYVDLIIANAGFAKDPSPLVNVPISEWHDHFTTNAIGPLLLFQSFQPLLAAKKGSKFVVVSSAAGSIGITGQYPLILPAYATSKATVNMIVRIAHTQSEADGTTIFPVHPGLVGTDMTGNIAEKFNLTPEMEVLFKSMMITPEQSAASLVPLIKGATRESHGGRFWSYDGTELEW